MDATDDRHDLPLDPATLDVVCRLEPDGTRRFNVPRRHVHHSPTGWRWGYAGSGPADFALNVLALFFPPAGPLPEAPADHAPTEAWDAYEAALDAAGAELRDGSRVPAAVWALHQEFKRAFVARLPAVGGTIRGGAIRAWLRERGALPAG